MKQTPQERLRELERQAIARHLATDPGPDELAFLAEVRYHTESGYLFEPRQWSAEDEREFRLLWIEAKLGLDARWADPTPDLFKDQAAYERFLVLATKEQAA